ncbi:MAG: putative substrate of the Dot/Icm secretion system, LepB-like [Gammaproteobacteria bacterium]|jgi:hypothetical protein|nr:putative substrate of the Dot/Icm secretion system, LepB-like [Gammaproteobacteria bacterium]
MPHPKSNRQGEEEKDSLNESWQEIPETPPRAGKPPPQRLDQSWFLSEIDEKDSDEELEAQEEKYDDHAPHLQLDLNPQAQFQRDISMIQGAIDSPGRGDPPSAEILKKIFILLHYGDLRYFKDGQWYTWDLPLASAIAHGARVTIDFPREISEEIREWLFAGTPPQNYERSAATHGLEAVRLEDGSFRVKETKSSLGKAGYEAARKAAAATLSYLPVVGSKVSDLVGMKKQNYGVNLALGGAGNKHPTSGNPIESNGEHGHAYIFYRPSIQQSGKGGLLIGIEQSAPGRPDQNGGSHGVMATHHAFSATGGEDLGRPNNTLTGKGPSRYYYGISLNLTKEQFQQLKNKEFNTEMLSSPGDQQVRAAVPYPDPETVAAKAKDSHAPVTLSYQGKNLTLQQKKEAGKNVSSFNGFYKDHTGKEYFIKVPSDPVELFTELFAGKLLTGLKNQGLVEKKYHGSLICADFIELPDGSYGLIQPKAEITEVWKYFEEKAKQGKQGYIEYAWQAFSKMMAGSKDRNVLYEMFYGQTQYYPQLAQLGSLDSLAACLFYSLLIGDNSVHSGNMAYFGEEGVAEFKRLDFGAALRYIGNENDSVERAAEYQGVGSYKAYTKGFFAFYKHVPGLFPLISQLASGLEESYTEDALFKIVLQAIKDIPLELLLEQSQQQAAARYMEIAEFGEIRGENSEVAQEAFAKELTGILLKRFQQLKALKEPEKILHASQAERLTSTRMFDFAFSQMKQQLQTKGAEVKIEMIEPDGTTDVYGARFAVGGGPPFDVTLLSAACDDKKPNMAAAAGATPLPDILKKIRILQKTNPDDVYFVPLAECHTVGGLLRQHWTMLMIKENECYFFDPCAKTLLPWGLSLSSVYSLKPLKEIVREQGFNWKTQKHSCYLGWQYDAVNCGRFTGEIIRQVTDLLYHETGFHSIKEELAKLQPPQAEDLVTAESQCKTAEEIRDNGKILAARGQGGDEPHNAEDPLEDVEGDVEELELDGDSEKEQKPPEKLNPLEAKPEEAEAAAEEQAKAAHEAEIPEKARTEAVEKAAAAALQEAERKAAQQELKAAKEKAAAAKEFEVPKTPEEEQAIREKQAETARQQIEAMNAQAQEIDRIRAQETAERIQKAEEESERAKERVAAEEARRAKAAAKAQEEEDFKRRESARLIEEGKMLNAKIDAELANELGAQPAAEEEKKNEEEAVTEKITPKKQDRYQFLELGVILLLPALVSTFFLTGTALFIATSIAVVGGVIALGSLVRNTTNYIFSNSSSSSPEGRPHSANSVTLNKQFGPQKRQTSRRSYDEEKFDGTSPHPFHKPPRGTSTELRGGGSPSPGSPASPPAPGRKGKR